MFNYVTPSWLQPVICSRLKFLSAPESRNDPTHERSWNDSAVFLTYIRKKDQTKNSETVLKKIKHWKVLEAELWWQFDKTKLCSCVSCFWDVRFGFILVLQIRVFYPVSFFFFYSFGKQRVKEKFVVRQDTSTEDVWTLNVYNGTCCLTVLDAFLVNRWTV